MLAIPARYAAHLNTSGSFLRKTPMLILSCTSSNTISTAMSRTEATRSIRPIPRLVVLKFEKKERFQVKSFDKISLRSSTLFALKNIQAKVIKVKFSILLRKPYVIEVPVMRSSVFSLSVKGLVIMPAT
jgi:hypothetical protein